MKCVLDASVIVKWLLRDPVREPGSDEAVALMQAVAAGEVEVVQPPHWLAEVAAVMARLSPATLEDDLADLCALEFEIADSLAIYRRAGRLAVELNQHVFDTLYHAVALETGRCPLITADQRYLRQAAPKGGIMDLADWHQAAGDAAQGIGEETARPEAPKP